jgi:hypothetical protein
VFLSAPAREQIFKAVSAAPQRRDKRRIQEKSQRKTSLFKKDKSAPATVLGHINASTDYTKTMP